MSITYDPEKWTNPLRARDFEPVRRRSSSPVLVSLRELRYFKAHSEIHAGTVSAFLSEGEDERGVDEPDGE
jgi:hypothetical protein